MTHRLQVWADGSRMAVIEHEARDDTWSLRYGDAWHANPNAYPLSPVLPLSAQAHASASVRRFIEHLLPEGRALDVAVAYNGLARSNVFGLIRALGAETAGALRFSDADAQLAAPLAEVSDPPPREIPLSELDERIAQRDALPFTVWDGRLRMSVAGLQDKLLVYMDAPPEQGGRLWLVDGQRLASTHILKPDTGNPRTPHLAVNEHFCMRLARRMGLPVAEVSLLRTPRPVLLVERFDRVREGADRVRRRHMVDVCQACDLPVSHKYERNLGSGREVQHIRDGVSFERLFGCAGLTANKTATRLTLLRWALFQFLIGNSDAHGKNFSFLVNDPGLLEPAPWYDLVSVLQYEGFDTELAMAWGDVFVHAEVSPFAVADFAARCGVPRVLLRREGQRLASLASEAATVQAEDATYTGSERAFAQDLARFVARQAQRLDALVVAAVGIRDEYL